MTGDCHARFYERRRVRFPPPTHHTAHHHGHYPIRITNHIPWVQLPTWQNTTRPWARNTTHHTHHTLANQTAHQLTHRPPQPWEQQPPNAA